MPSARSTSSAVATIASRLSARRGVGALRGVHHGGSGSGAAMTGSVLDANTVRM